MGKCRSEWPVPSFHESEGAFGCLGFGVPRVAQRPIINPTNNLVCASSTPDEPARERQKDWDLAVLGYGSGDAAV
jgi:hypothetical protein